MIITPFMPYYANKFMPHYVKGYGVFWYKRIEHKGPWAQAWSTAHLWSSFQKNHNRRRTNNIVIRMRVKMAPRGSIRWSNKFSAHRWA